ncbi:MAG: hypothetical protein O2963_04505, partial [Proteobacteria bacterium]|nr:hypothetical protein [Pseudomonadota bacterium]
MKLTIKRSALALTFMVAGMLAATAQADQPSTANGEWPHYTGDILGSRYSPLDQINADNFEE